MAQMSRQLQTLAALGQPLHRSAPKPASILAQHIMLPFSDVTNVSPEYVPGDRYDVDTRADWRLLIGANLKPT